MKNPFNKKKGEGKKPNNLSNDPQNQSTGTVSTDNPQDQVKVAAGGTVSKKPTSRKSYGELLREQNLLRQKRRENGNR